MSHYPKGGRCTACSKRLDDCSALPFATMPPHRRDGADTVVICTEFVKSDAPGKGFWNKKRPSGGR